MKNNINQEAIGLALERPIAFHRIFRTISGSTVAALFLSQAWYWRRKGSSADGWIYKTQIEWEEETGLSRKEQETARKHLTGKDFLQEKKAGIPRRLYFKINEAKIYEEITKISNTEHNNPSMSDVDNQVSPNVTSQYVPMSHTSMSECDIPVCPDVTHQYVRMSRTNTENTIQRIQTENTNREYRTEIREERTSATLPDRTEVCDCEILEESEPIENLPYPITIHTPIVVKSENKKVPGAARGRKAIETDHVTLVCAAWNEQKGGLWASIRVPPTEARSKAVLRFVSSCDSIETAIEYLTGALTHMRSEEYWASAKGLTIENVLSNGKVQQNYEKYLDLKENPAIGEVAEKLKQMQEPKSFEQMRMESNKRAGLQAVINRMKNHPEEFEPEELAEYRSKYPQEFETRSSLHAEF